ncbi:MAG: glycerol-3-phosphate dehydrogenase [Pseudomonadota bacterium]
MYDHRGHDPETPIDIFVIGGGINGCGLARDAAGRGLAVTLAEMNDIGWATSSASTKLFHGGLRYLEFFEFKLVRESLKERETLLKMMPHISWPMRFVLPYHKDMRFESETPTSRLLGWIMPWKKGARPAWLIRFGLFLYDSLAFRFEKRILPGTTSVDLSTAPEGAPLRPKFAKAFEYSDCWVEDSRLVALNARDAYERGATIWTRTQVVSVERLEKCWAVTCRHVETGEERTVYAGLLVNAAGPWVADVLSGVVRLNTSESVRLVRGSHIITKRLYDHDKCYFFQGEDGRIIFAIPYETDFTLIGTTDQEHTDPDTPPVCTPEENAYLRAFAAKYFETEIAEEDVVHTYSGVRPLYDDGAKSATAATREYVLSLDEPEGQAPLLSIFGGKITTYRSLAEHAIDKVRHLLINPKGFWTDRYPLPGGDFPVTGVEDLIAELRKAHPFLTERWAKRLVKAYGTDAAKMLEDRERIEDMGELFGATLTELEVRWLVTHEFATKAEDILWRRSKLGLHMTAQEVAEFTAWFDKAMRTPAWHKPEA